MMLFRLDYEFTSGAPDSATKYVWVIQRDRLPPVKFLVPLGQQDELMTPVQQWRQEHGPFRSHIEDAQGRVLSNSIPLDQ